MLDALELTEMKAVVEIRSGRFLSSGNGEFSSSQRLEGDATMFGLGGPIAWQGNSGF